MSRGTSPIGLLPHPRHQQTAFANLLDNLKGFYAVRLAYAQVIPANVARLLLIVTGPGMSPIEQNIDTSTGRVTVNVPVGNDRLFEVRAFPAGSAIPNFIGRTTTDVSPTGTNVTINMRAANLRPPVANAGPDQAVLFVGQVVQLDGSGSSDADGNPLTFRWSFTSRPPGSQAALSDATLVNPTFVADVLGTYVVRLLVNDGTVDSLPDTVMVTADNVRPVANAGPDQAVLFVGQVVQLDGRSSSDADGDPLTFRWSFTSRPPGSQAILSDPTLVNPTFVTDVLGTYALRLLVNDGTVDSLPDTVMVTADNIRPVANAGPDQPLVSVPQTVQLNGRGSSDADGNPLTFRWSFTSRPPGSQVILSDPTLVNPTFVTDVLGTYVLQLLVNDGTVDSLPDTVMVTADNIRPVANAGPDQPLVSVPQTVQLNGRGSSDADGDPLTFRWSFTSQPPNSQATPSDSTLVNPTFVADQLGTYVVQLLVNDGTVDSLPDTVIVTAENTRPVASAGPDQPLVSVPQPVQLNGSGSSDADGNPLTFRWSFTSRPAGSEATLSDPTLVNPTFVVDALGTYVLQLLVNDGTVDSLPDTVMVTADNIRPVANAGPDQPLVSVPQTVQLNGSGSSDADGNPLTFRWSFTSRPAGSEATLSNPNLPNPTFIADVVGIYMVQLIVNDGIVDSPADTVIVTADNIRPVANAGPDQPLVSVPQPVQLNGSGSSDADGDPLTFAWAFTSRPAGSQATLSDPTLVNPTFVADQLGTYVVQLLVNDGTLDSPLDAVIVTADNIRPVANAGPNQPLVSVPQPVQLDGSGSSDADGDPLTFRWSFTSRPAGSEATLSNPNLPNPTFVADQLGTYVVQLIVNDGTVDSPAATVTITAGNTIPVANAGPDQTVVSQGLLGFCEVESAEVQLDGSDSSDADGDPLTFRWNFTSLPAGSGGSLFRSTTENPTFESCGFGTYVLQLIVNDGAIDSLADTVTIVVSRRPPVADAGDDQAVLIGQTVQLDGSGSSEADGNPLPPSATFRWSFTSRPLYSLATLANPNSPSPTFGADVLGDYVVQLIVNNGIVDSPADTVTITTTGYYIGGSIDSKTRFASIIGTASLTVMILGFFSRRHHGSTRQRIER